MAGVSTVAVQCPYMYIHVRSGSHEPSGGSYAPVYNYIYMYINGFSITELKSTV